MFYIDWNYIYNKVVIEFINDMGWSTKEWEVRTIGM